MRLTSLVVSTIVFFLAGHFTKRWLDDNDIPKGMTRSALVFSIALAVAYGAQWLFERLI